MFCQSKHYEVAAIYQQKKDVHCNIGIMRRECNAACAHKQAMGKLCKAMLVLCDIATGCRASVCARLAT